MLSPCFLKKPSKYPVLRMYMDQFCSGQSSYH